MVQFVFDKLLTIIELISFQSVNGNATAFQVEIRIDGCDLSYPR
nr:MAG TPA: hypothetical protein [Caudoviricetes sp.]